MRFSAAFNLPLPLPLALPRAAPPADRMHSDARVMAATVRWPLPQDLPEELDARVRLVGEWQLGEG